MPVIMRWFTVFVMAAGQVAAVSDLVTEPVVHWSMDLYNNSKLLADFSAAGRYTSDLPEFVNYVRPGVIGNALYLSSKKVKLIEDMWRSDCLRNPVQCEDGLTIAFWLKIEKFATGKDQAILRTSNPTRSRPGLYIGKSGGEELLFMIRTAEGKRFQASIQLSIVTDQWSHLAMFWNSTTGIQISVNSSLLSDDLYAESPVVENVSSSYPSKVDFIAGDIPGPVFLLDDLWIFYHKLTNGEVYSLFELGIPKEQAPPDAFTVDYEFRENSTISTDPKFNSTDLSRETGTMANSRTSDGIATNSVTDSKLISTDGAEIPGSTVAITTTHSPKSSPTPKSKATIKNRVVSRGPTTTTTPYSGWFYLQSWYYTLLGVVVLLMFAFSTWQCVIHCFMPAVEERQTKSAAKREQFTSLEPLVENT